MARPVEESRYFADEAAAQAFAADFEAEWGGPGSPYDPRCLVLPPNDDRPTWLVIARRYPSAE